MLTIYKKEVKSYFISMIGYVFVALMLAVGGMYFMAYNLSYGYTYFSYALYSTTFVLLIAVPVLTMRCFAEDRKNKTDQLLITAPVSLTEIVLGKYAAMLTVFAVPMAVFCIFPLIIKSYGTAQFMVDYSSMLAYFLFGAVCISFGMYVSSLTESQVLAAIGTFAALFVIYIWDGLVSFISVDEVKTFLSEYSLLKVLENFTLNYLFDVTGLLVYLSVIAIFVFLTVQALQKRRWN